MKYGQQITDEICKWLRAGNNQEDSAILAGIAECTFYAWMKKPKFSEAIKKALVECKAKNIDIIQKAAQKTWQASAWWLERKYNEEFALRQKNDFNHTHKFDGQIQVTVIKANADKCRTPGKTRPASRKR